MALDEKTELEYMLLRNYQDNGLVGRGFLLRVSLVALEQIEQDKWYAKIDENEKPKVRSFMQMDIISKIMMYIEDLAILSESFVLQRNFYDLLQDDCIDIGKMVGNFFKRIDLISDEDIYKIMSYRPKGKFDLNGRSAEILNKSLNSNIKEIKRMLKEIGDFGTMHHPLFKRFKHAGMPVICGSLNTSTGSDLLAEFDLFNIVPIGPNPLVDIMPIPYSKKALDSYWIIIHGLQKILSDMVKNRLICIQRNLTSLIPNQRYDITTLSADEAHSMKKIVDIFYASNPAKEIIISHNYNENIDKEKIRWYLNLSSFLTECKQRKDIEDKYNS